MVSGYYAPVIKKCGHFTKYINICVANGVPIIKLLNAIIDSDIAGVNIDVISSGGINISVIVTTHKTIKSMPQVLWIYGDII